MEINKLIDQYNALVKQYYNKQKDIDYLYFDKGVKEGKIQVDIMGETKGQAYKVSMAHLRAISSTHEEIETKIKQAEQEAEEISEEAKKIKIEVDAYRSANVQKITQEDIEKLRKHLTEALARGATKKDILKHKAKLTKMCKKGNVDTSVIDALFNEILIQAVTGS